MLKGKFKEAFDKLQALGAPVVDPEGTGYEQYTYEDGQFILDGEAGMYEFINYFPVSYSTWYCGTYSDEVHEILKEFGLWAEWQNPAVLLVSDNS